MPNEKLLKITSLQSDGNGKNNIVYSNSHLSLTSWHPIYVSVTFLFVIFIVGYRESDQDRARI